MNMKSLMGGILIGIGGTAFLSVDDKVVGAFLFSVCLYAILATGQLLLTGRAAYTCHLRELAGILLGNACGAVAVGLLAGPDVRARAALLCQAKLGGMDSLIVAGILCNLLIYVAVEAYGKAQPLLTVMCVMAFILCGYEHSIANMFYFAAARRFSPEVVMFLVVNVLSNVFCGQCIFAARLFASKIGNKG